MRTRRRCSELFHGCQSPTKLFFFLTEVAAFPRTAPTQTTQQQNYESTIDLCVRETHHRLHHARNPFPKLQSWRQKTPRARERRGLVCVRDVCIDRLRAKVYLSCCEVNSSSRGSYLRGRVRRWVVEGPAVHAFVDTAEGREDESAGPVLDGLRS